MGAVYHSDLLLKNKTVEWSNVVNFKRVDPNLKPEYSSHNSRFIWYPRDLKAF